MLASHVTPESVIHGIRGLMASNHMELVCLRGSCLHFAFLLRHLFGGMVMINPAGDHVATLIDGNLYDIRGALDPKPTDWTPITEEQAKQLAQPYSLLHDTNRATRRTLTRKHR